MERKRCCLEHGVAGGVNHYYICDRCRHQQYPGLPGQRPGGDREEPDAARDQGRGLRGSLGAFSSALREGIDGAVADAARRTGKTPEELAPSMCIASGMITSELGLCEIPHLAAPAGLDDLASHVVARRFAGISPSPFVFIPGVKIPGDPFAEDPVASPDMMRGEETQIMGLLVNRSPSTPVLVTILGSHTKFIVVDAQGRISRSLTTLSGELIKAINSATILSSSLPRHMPDRRAASAELVRKGIRLAEGSGFTRSLFALRLLNRLSSLGPEDCFDLLAGVAAAEDLRALLTSGLLDAPLRTVLLAG
ncbi:MAG: 2-dehydro-3-deoxygalactonokinase, partial [Firmicutes bacterium]|nr:2-dehydro-3-deoxygalactonokinase [Bacillota bacterium]